MTPQAFIEALKKHVREAAASEVDYYASPPVSHPPEHLGRFSEWFRQLSVPDQSMVREIVAYAHLFGLLMYLDNLATLTDDAGQLELWYVSENGDRMWLNDPNGEMLQDLFNDSD